MVSCSSSTALASRDLYAVDTAGNRIFAFGVSSGGGLAALQGYPAYAGVAPSAVVPGRDATRLYVTLAGANTITTYRVDSSGALAVLGSPVPTGSGPSAAAVSPDGSRLFVANAGDNSISRYAVNSNGSLSSLGAATPTGASPAGLAMTPNGSYLFAADKGDNLISIFSASGTGSLSALGTAPTGGAPTGLAVTPDGSHLYATNSTDGTVSGWTIGSDGTLTALGDPVSAGSGARAIAIAPDGTRALVANAGDNSVSRFLIGVDGNLASVGTATPGPAGAESVVVSPDGQHAYVGGTTALSAFDVSPAAELTAVLGSPISTNGDHSWLAISPNQAPQAKFDRVAGFTGQPSSFDASSSLDLDGTVTSWQWDFGDGTTGQGAQTTHVYQQAGTYLVTLRVADNEGCSVAPAYTGQSTSCTAGSIATRTIDISDAPPTVIPEPPCLHDGNDGFCGTPDQKAPTVTVLGFNDGASISTLDAPEELVGTITPDPSGIARIMLRFTKTDGVTITRKAVTKKVCRHSHGRKRCRTKPVYKKTCKRVKGKRRCIRSRVVKISRLPACLTVSGSKTYLVRYECSKVPWITVTGDSVFRYSIPAVLSPGTYTVEVIAVDGAGNADVLEDGRNKLTFKIVHTASNQDSGGGTVTTGGGTTTTPIQDTGSPFG